jgi:hypothetical protein
MVQGWPKDLWIHQWSLKVVATNKLDRLSLAFFKQFFFLGKHNNKPNLTTSYKLAPPSQTQL